MSILTISLPERLKDFIESEVSNGGYSTASEFVRELIRAAQKQKSGFALEQLIEAGLNSGGPKEMTEADWNSIRNKVRKIKSRHP